jgi:hypothetical protein
MRQELKRTGKVVSTGVGIRSESKLTIVEVVNHVAVHEESITQQPYAQALRNLRRKGNSGATVIKFQTHNSVSLRTWALKKPSRHFLPEDLTMYLKGCVWRLAYEGMADLGG